MNIKEQVQKIDTIVSQGAIVDALKEFFADNANTSDYGNGGTKGKLEMITKMEGFAGAIDKVNEITHHHSIVDGNVSASEFTFNFDMKDGNKIYWHEIIRRIWNDEGKVTHEEYFNAE
ncbi:hypothetical protein [Flavivirga spongiicola]|uniref:Nuclear transport factor 2 family protein n=1 Tax=Flavivirga spongiicola TaxID=421621 RepID=A0ABU7XMW3_9FLAO|nr:hypothetical protein [Flavivirga sp. MEBiC05379]MDO5981530.1 hypothetical protein [Flavivirga sp. MEBiC05379]